MKNNKIKLLIIGILLVALAAPAAVLAYFTDYEEAWGGAVLNLEGETTIEEKADSAKKEVNIRNTGETDVIVRVAIYGDFVEKIDYDEGDWTHQEGDDWYYYNRILKPGEATASQITAWIDQGAAGAAGHDFDVVVVHESERVSYDGSAAFKVNKPEGWTNMPDIAGEASEEVGD